MIAVGNHVAMSRAMMARAIGRCAVAGSSKRARELGGRVSRETRSVSVSGLLEVFGGERDERVADVLASLSDLDSVRECMAARSVSPLVRSDGVHQAIAAKREVEHPLVRVRVDRPIGLNRVDR